MFCTIKFVYYKSFCVRDDIGSYIRTVYHMVSHTPKRKVGDSNSFWRAINNAESLYFQRFSAFLFFCCGWRFAGKQARKCFCVKRGCGAESPLRASFRALPFRLWGSRSHLQYLNIPPYYVSGFSALICLYFQHSTLHGFFHLCTKETARQIRFRML